MNVLEVTLFCENTLISGLLALFTAGLHSLPCQT